MNWIGLLSFLLTLGITVSSLTFAPAISHWLDVSGLDYLNREIQYLNYATFLVSFVFLLLHYIIIFKLTNFTTFIFTYSISCFGLIEFFYGLFLFMDSNGYLSTMYDKWEESINDSKLHAIERRFGCCGFHKFFQFPNDECNWSIVPCLSAMHVKLAEPTKAIGRTLLFHALIHAMIGVFLGYAAQKRKRKHTYDAGEWENERLDPNYVEPKYK